MKPLEWEEIKRGNDVLHKAVRGELATFAWYSEAKEKWMWEVDFFDRICMAGSVATVEEAKQECFSYAKGIIQMLAGDGAK